ncbi:MAG: hypothetical protein GY847_07955 [Proteobacteria bacterium]|nr:hypothetical protein [Pseudomonadota bacterium]
MAARRCPYYVLAEVEDGKVMESRVKKSLHFRKYQPGQKPVYVRGLGADVILAGGMGPSAVDMFRNFGIEVATGAVGNVGKVLEAYLRGKTKGIVPCERDHPQSCGNHYTQGRKGSVSNVKTHGNNSPETRGTRVFD